MKLRTGKIAINTIRDNWLILLPSYFHKWLPYSFNNIYYNVIDYKFYYTLKLVILITQRIKKSLSPYHETFKSWIIYSCNKQWWFNFFLPNNTIPIFYFMYSIFSETFWLFVCSYNWFINRWWNLIFDNK